MTKNFKNTSLLSKKKFQHFCITHILLLIGIVTVPFNNWYLYDLLIFMLFTCPINSIIQHLYFNHNYIDFKNKIFKIFWLLYIVLFNHWKFTDVKSYHISHHKNWLTSLDPTSSELQQGFLKYYVGITQPIKIDFVSNKKDNVIDFLNNYFYIIKIFLIIALVIFFGWTLFFHLILIQQFLWLLAGRIHDYLFHKNNELSDKPWLFPIFWSDSWHIEHHKTYEKNIWHWKYINIQYYYCKLFFKSI
jgi:hypothetical protein